VSKICIIGGLGFIGSHLSLSLANSGNIITIVDNFKTINLDLFKNIKNSKNIKIYNKDYQSMDFNFINKIIDKNTSIFHLAAVSRVRDSSENYIKDIYENNIIGLFNFVNELKKTNYKKFIFASSSSVYGHMIKLTSSENDNCNPVNLYGTSKLIGEQIIKQNLNKYIIMRLFNVYGNCKYKNSKNNLLLQNIIEKSNNFKLEGNGDVKRDFIYIEDVINIFRISIKKTINNKIFNVGSGRNISVNKFISTFTNLKNAKKIKGRSNEVQSTRANIDKIKNIIIGNHNTH